MITLGKNENQIERDLLLSQAMIEIANDDLLGEELVLRGGTAFHKLFLPEPYRYSEDLDFVRTTSGGLGEVMKGLTALGGELGFDARTKMGKFPKIYWRFAFEDGRPPRQTFLSARQMRAAFKTFKAFKAPKSPPKESDCWKNGCKFRQIDDIRWLKGRRYFQVKTSRCGVFFCIALTRCYSLAYMGG